MKWFESTIAYLFPTILIDGTPWRSLWEIQQQEQFVRVARFFFPFPAVGYIAHYYYFDVPMGLEPIEFWFQFRATMSAACLVVIAFYFSPLARTRIYKIPAMLLCFGICYSQAKVTVWYGKEAWVFFFLFILAMVMLLRMSSLNSVAYGALVVAVSVPVLMDGGVTTENIVSGSIVTLSLCAMVRAAFVSDVRNFLLNQENIAAQEKIIELSQDFSNRIKSFIPKVIADRLTHYMEEDRLTVVEASIEALKARKQDIACLFTDIRGYTQGSKDIDRFINESVMPEVKECSDTIERLQGIPRKVGDLIFAYFDTESVQLNTLRALIAGIEVSRINESMNATGTALEIRRYILIASGDAFVGNFGGLDSSIEITALGSPVNYLSRVDDLTKAPALASKIDTGDILISQRAFNLVNDGVVALDCEMIDLSQLDLAIRDFPEETIIYRLIPTDAIYESLLNAYDRLIKPNAESLIGRNGSIAI